MMTHLASALTSACLSALEQKPAKNQTLRFTGQGSLASAYPVSDLAAACHAAVGFGVARLIDPAGQQSIEISVDRRLAAGWFQQSIKPLGWEIPAPWDSITGDYRSQDGWIRLHTNAPHHRLAAQQVLGVHDNKAAMAPAVLRWRSDELEAAIVGAGGCSASMRSPQEWASHPQGRSVSREPLIDLQTHSIPGAAGLQSFGTAARPLEGIRVLDLTRVLAGPVATRVLAGFGAQVLRIDPPLWDEPAVVPEVTLGKRCARLDLRDSRDLNRFRDLLAQADVLVHGLRRGALDGLGFDEATRRTIAPGLIDVSLNAYGWHGPWSARRGFDSLVQMSCGIAHAGMRWRGAEQPVPLPAQALDHATGWLMAASVIHGLAGRRMAGQAVTARLSLARTAALLMDHATPVPDTSISIAPFDHTDYLPQTEHTAWGPGRRLLPALSIDGAPGSLMTWTRGATTLGADQAAWVLP